jgi:hypothetical protein
VEGARRARATVAVLLWHPVQPEQVHMTHDASVPRRVIQQHVKHGPPRLTTTDPPWESHVPVTEAKQTSPKLDRIGRRDLSPTD